ncbi:MAG: hypothetical protein Q9220_002968 [cf. Caloplaca sp. 1 TL-2023]
MLGCGVFVRDGTTQASKPTSTSASTTSPGSTPSSSTTTSTTARVSAGSTSNTAGSLASTSRPTAAPIPPKAGVNAGAIAGGVVGGLAFIVLILVAGWLLFSKRRKAGRAARDNMTQSHGHQESYYGDYKPPEIQEAQGSYVGEIKRTELQGGSVDKTLGRSELGAR